MKKMSLFFLYCLMVPALTLCHMREKNDVQCVSCCVPKTPLVEEIEKPITESERDHLMFTNFIGIVVNFVKIFLDPHNIPEAKQNAFNILNGIYSLAGIITRSDFSPVMQERLAHFIIEYCQKNAVILNKE
jgi:hypothetical protein